MGVSGASGILIGDGKFVLTNRHVVEMGKLYAVRNAMGRVSNARLVKVSEVDDLALLSVDEAFPAAQSIGVQQMAAARAGSQIYSMGYPLWFLLGSQTPSITNGLVSKISGLNDEPSMFQISAKVNKGNSGGPVFDSYGRLIGVTMGKLDTEYLRKTDGVNAEGVNFIIHTERILKFLGTDSKLAPASSHAAPLQPEMIYDKMLGAVVIVAVAIQ
jgi:S1-C subfamily serine protease